MAEDDENTGGPFPPECPSKTQKWLGRLAAGFLQFVSAPNDVALAYSALCRHGEDPTDPKSAWALQFSEAPSEHVGGHRDGERVVKGFAFCLSGFVSWLYEKKNQELHITVDLAAVRDSDKQPMPHIRVMGKTKLGREFAVVIYTAPNSSIPTYHKIRENKPDKRG